MDIRIKGEMDGIDTAEEIRNRFGIPIIFSTAYLDEERIERAKITMPFGYVLKPIQERDLKVTIEIALYVAKMDKERRRAEYALKERVKEGECFYGISELVERTDKSLDEILKGIIHIISQSWQYPEITHSRIVFDDGKEILCSHGRLPIEEKWSQSARIRIQEKVIGSLIIFYSEERPQADEGVFLREERLLLNTIAERLGNVIESFEVKQSLIESEEWFSTTLKSIGDAVIATDINGHVTLLNPIAESLTGWNQKDAIGRPLKEVFNIINEESREPVENHVDKVIKENRIVGLANLTILVAKD